MNRRHPDASGAALHQHRLAGSRLRLDDERVPGRIERHRDASPFFIRVGLGQFRRGVGCEPHVLGVASPHGAAIYALPDPPTLHALAQGDDLSRSLGARNIRRRHQLGVRVLGGPYRQIHRVDADSASFYQHLAGRRPCVFHLVHPHRNIHVEFMYAHRFHQNSHSSV